jgi:hypothetical protein
MSKQIWQRRMWEPVVPFTKEKCESIVYLCVCLRSSSFGWLSQTVLKRAPTITERTTCEINRRKGKSIRCFDFMTVIFFTTTLKGARCTLAIFLPPMTDIKHQINARALQDEDGALCGHVTMEFQSRSAWKFALLLVKSSVVKERQRDCGCLVLHFG